MQGWEATALGGVLIGLSAALLFAGNGRIAGISGIVFALLRRAAEGDRAWRIAFLLGLMGAGALAMHALGQQPVAVAPTWQVVVAGLLVGYGTRLGSGCTSGHGVCGLARFSLRSAAAVAAFMAAGMLTVFVVRHVLGAGS